MTAQNCDALIVQLVRCDREIPERWIISLRSGNATTLEGNTTVAGIGLQVKVLLSLLTRVANILELLASSFIAPLFRFGANHAAGRQPQASSFEVNYSSCDNQLTATSCSHKTANMSGRQPR